jgi:hypothetical protein
VARPAPALGLCLGRPGRRAPAPVAASPLISRAHSALAAAVEVGASPFGQVIDDTGSGTDQGFTRHSAGDAPDLTIVFPDHLSTVHSPQGSAHLLPQLELQRIHPQELGDGHPHTPVRELTKGDLGRVNTADVPVIDHPLPVLLAAFTKLVRWELIELADHRHSLAMRIHSDRGSQFRAHAYVRLLRASGLTGSMGRAGACGDNAAMESFFALLQKNVLDRSRWETRDQLRLAIITWIERTYHRRRRQRRLGKLTPIEYEMLYTKAALAA